MDNTLMAIVDEIDYASFRQGMFGLDEDTYFKLQDEINGLKDRIRQKDYDGGDCGDGK